ncbi:uncharacterized protein A4U43_C07F18730 [Asparagus officinalis]|uniref:Ubiquitin-conjugating enzyme E2 H n=1 Tax=Asparagus officinalis TaxID=4686 RepID=A0A5P1ED16_ASPOF|nr:ubiquitin-conjugating enzyme E2 4-like isoform X2 [Asparagus officinalis]XP_020276673.1 ubiquitin-conjugating enzyme E2 4-like isoform X2 [Asparagus officinalis]ONK63768.1 uncharacterized protein A4U43_C07F18730 [Asparagus officinalis]
MSSSNDRRQREIMDLMMKDFKVELVNDSVKEFFVELHGPEDSLYQGGVWRVRVELPDDYPVKSPSIGFATKIFHPNVDGLSGSVCLNLLNQDWSSVFDLVMVFKDFLPRFLKEPNPDDPMNPEAAELMIHDRPAYEQRVKEYCETYAKPQGTGSPEEDTSSNEEMSEVEHNDDEDTEPGNPNP